MKVFENDVDTFVAEDLEHVAALFHAQYRATLEQEGLSLDDFEQVPDDKLITICNVHDGGVDDKETRTAAEWARINGPGLLASTEW